MMQGDGVLIGVDPANGTERWQRQLPPGSMRYVTPYDAGYACLEPDGTRIHIAAGQALWQLNAATGNTLREIKSPEPTMSWGYVAQSGDQLFASLMKPTAARTAADKQTRYGYVNSDYRSERPLVTSRALHCLATDGKPQWNYTAKGVILNSSIAIGNDRILFVAGTSEACVQHKTDRIALATLMEDASLVCLNRRSGEPAWVKPLAWPGARNMLFGQVSDRTIVLSTSSSGNDLATYQLRSLMSSSLSGSSAQFLAVTR